MKRSTFKQLSHPPRVKSAVAISALVGLASLGGVLAGSPVLAAGGLVSCSFAYDAMTGGGKIGTCINDPMGMAVDIGDNPTFSLGDKKYSNLSFSLGSDVGDGGSIAFHDSVPGYWMTEIAWQPLAFTGPMSGAYTGSFSYEMEITDPPPQSFATAYLDSVVNVVGGVNVVKTIEFLDPMSGDWTLMSDDGDPDGPTAFPVSMVRKIRVTDSWTLPVDTQMRSITNTFTQVPGPLPVLGAGAAFGFSRKLRSRVRLARGV